jgi:copper(I)-binding protein
MARFTVLILSALFAASAWAAGLSVSEAWIRHLPAGVPAGGYFTLQNQGKKAVTLVGASSPAYGMAMMHKTFEESGLSKMIAVDRIDVPAGGKLVFGPGAYHLMLVRAAHDIKIGSKIPVALKFSDGQKITAQFEVRGPTAK